MACRLLFLRVLTLLCAAPPLLAAQRPRFGIAAGKSFVGGGDSRTLVDAGGFNVTGADQAGFHIRGMAEVPLNSAAFAFRAEVFYNTLHSRPNSVAIVGSGRSEEHTSELQSQSNLVCRLLLEKKDN